MMGIGGVDWYGETDDAFPAVDSGGEVRIV
jgi:hypothetical protein